MVIKRPHPVLMHVAMERVWQGAAIAMLVGWASTVPCPPATRCVVVAGCAWTECANAVTVIAAPLVKFSCARITVGNRESVLLEAVYAMQVMGGSTVGTQCSIVSALVSIHPCLSRITGQLWGLHNPLILFLQ